MRQSKYQNQFGYDTDDGIIRQGIQNSYDQNVKCSNGKINSM